MPLKRPASHQLQSPKVGKMMLIPHDFEVQNVVDEETVHQHCILLSGQCKVFEHAREDFVSVKVTDAFGQTCPVQNWPVVSGKWKALAMLNPGPNKVEMRLHHSGSISIPYQLNLTYQPLLQLPPLHLAILVAKDSPLLIDCPPARRGAISTAHSTLDAAIVKFRMAAYMWQALTAEDLRQKGLGRRAFRLDEEWGVDTTTWNSLQTDSGSQSYTGTSAKVHIVRCDKTLAEIRDAHVAQQNPLARRRDYLHRYFEEALKAHGAPFSTSERPVVAGLFLDSHYSVDQNLILGHAALGCYKPDGISLGVFGSHTSYSWPRFLEEVPACLMDRTYTGDSVGNDNGECNTMSEACYVGQGAFLHEVGHAFGAGHTSGIMARGYSKHWPRNFIASDEDESANDARWDLEDALRFRLRPHFLLPGESLVSQSDRDSPTLIRCGLGHNGEPCLEISCKAGIARMQCNIPGGESIQVIDFKSGLDSANFGAATFDGFSLSIGLSALGAQFDRTKELSVSVLGMNGTKRVCNDVWKLMADLPYIRIPGHSVILRKQSIKSDNLNEDNGQCYMRWAMLLNRKLDNGELDRASAIDLRVGCTMDGAVVHYESGAHVNCGPVSCNGRPHTFGGHASAKQTIPKGFSIAKVEIHQNHGGWGSLDGIRMTLEDGTEWGELNKRTEKTEILQPDDDERIVGFYGQSDVSNGYTYEFGIITAKKSDTIPDICYDMPELQNRDNDTGCDDSEEDETMDEDDEDDEDGY